MSVVRIPSPWRVVRNIAGTVLSFEFLLVLFLFAGRLKANPRLGWLPFDLTAVTLVATVLAAAYLFYRRSFLLPRRGLALSCVALLLGGWIAASLFWTPSVIYARDKVLSLAVLAYGPLIACACLIAPERARLHRFVVACVGFGVAMSLDLVLVALAVGPSRVMFEVGTEYLGVGRVVGLAAPVCLLMASRGRTTTARFLLSGCFLVMLAALLLAGGRGPAVACLASLLVVPTAVAVGRRRPRGFRRFIRLLLGLALVVTVALVVLTAVGVRLAVVERTEMTFTQDSGGHSTAERLRYYGEALQAWREDPFRGRGVGSFPVLFERADEAFYPHNIFLEILVENGIVGVLLFLLLVMAGLRGLGIRWESQDWLRLAILMIFVNAFVNAQVTADLPDNRLLFAALGLMAMPPAVRDPAEAGGD